MNSHSSIWRRFVVLFHQVGEGLDRSNSDHFDWMFEQEDGLLQTWETVPLRGWDARVTLETRRLQDHRIHYLDWEGEISGNRGRVKRLIRGTHRNLDVTDDRIQLLLQWKADEKTLTAELDLYRSSACDLSRRDAWRLSFSPGRYETN